MKNLIKFTLVAAVAATVGSTAAFADNQQHQNQLAIQRAQDAQNQRTTTVAVYGHRGLGHFDRAMDEQRSAARFEMRSNAHGQQFGVFVAEK